MNAAGRDACYHCGEPLSPGMQFAVAVDGQERRVCCLGCRAAAELIRDAGLGDYYRFRSAPGARPATTTDDVWSTYDRADVAAPLLGSEHGLAVVNLLLEGMRCAACSWLIGERLAQVAGIARANVNPATARAQIAFDPARCTLGTVLRSIAALGYRPHVLGAADTLAVATRERRLALKRLAVAGFGMGQVMMIAVALYIGAADHMEPLIREYLRIISLIVTTPVLVYAGRPFFAGAYQALRLRSIGMDVPVAAAIGLAWLASAWNTLTRHGEVYFDSVTMFIFLLLLGRYVEMLARHRAGSTAEALLRLVPATAERLVEGRRERVPVSTLASGDVVLVPVGDCFPADGVVVRGATAADEALLTGESLPVAKPTGTAVIAGAVNAGAPVEVRLTAVGQSTVLAGIVRLLERAQTERPQLARLADRAAAWFVTRVLLGALLVAGVWLVIDPSRALAATLAVLVATCPCALSLATPTAITAAAARLARQGMLLTRADALEALAAADTVVFDKTGTLTYGQPTLTHVTTFAGSEAAALGIAAALEQASEHPLRHAFAHLTSVAPAAEVTVHPGSGIEGRVGAQRYRIGSAPFVGELARSAPPAGRDGGVLLGSAAGWLAHFEFGDTFRPEARAVVADLARLGLRPCIASGDHAATVAAAARTVGIDEWHARLLPADKLALVDGFRERGRHVLAVGDGINDAPVLRAASVSVALGSGSALAQASADLVALGGDLTGLPLAVGVARRTVRVVRQNLAWAAGYNLIALPLAACGLVPPWAAAIGMSASSLLVVLNALRLMRAPAARHPVRPGAALATPQAAL
jgi:Cu2+-exporting ATPase